MTKKTDGFYDNCIDFVISWVDGNDSTWQKKYAQYMSQDLEIVADKEKMFRDYGTIKYLFRSIEMYASWVRKIYLVTDQQIPSFLNDESEISRLKNIADKIVFINHADYIPTEYLPTFNSHTIELNFHRIEGLSEQFVYFNDDFLLTRPCKPTDFFKDGKPVDEACLNGINGKDGVFAGIQFHNMELMNRHYDINDVRKNLSMWLNPLYGKENMRTLFLLPFHRLQGIHNPHGPMPLLKQTYKLLWERDGEILRQTCLCKERSEQNVSIYVMRYEQLLSGNFCPTKSRNAYLEVTDSEMHIKRSLEKSGSVCINDVNMSQDDYLSCKKKIADLLEEKYKFGV